jgi:hypothetical protein
MAVLSTKQEAASLQCIYLWFASFFSIAFRILFETDRPFLLFTFSSFIVCQFKRGFNLKVQLFTSLNSLIVMFKIKYY